MRSTVAATSLASFRPRREDRPQREEHHDPDDLTHQDRAVQVERGTPRGITVLDDPRADRTGRHPKAAATVAEGVTTAAATADHVRRRDDGDAVLLIGLAVHATHRDRIAHLVDRVERIHRLTSNV